MANGARNLVTRWQPPEGAAPRTDFFAFPLESRIGWCPPGEIPVYFYSGGDAMPLGRGFALETMGGQVGIVPIQAAPDLYFDDDIPAPDPGFADFAERFRVICDLLDKGPRKSAPIRIAALKRILGYDNTSLRQGARRLRCSPSTLHAAVKAILKGMESNTF